MQDPFSLLPLLLPPRSPSRAPSHNWGPGTYLSSLCGGPARRRCESRRQTDRTPAREYPQPPDTSFRTRSAHTFPYTRSSNTKSTSKTNNNENSDSSNKSNNASNSNSSSNNKSNNASNSNSSSRILVLVIIIISF